MEAEINAFNVLPRTISNHYYGIITHWKYESASGRVYYECLGALVLVETLLPQLTPWSKYSVIKTICFCKENRKHKIKLLKIQYVDQLGDIFTKGLSCVLFEYLWRKIVGWLYLFRYSFHFWNLYIQVIVLIVAESVGWAPFQPSLLLRMGVDLFFEIFSSRHSPVYKRRQYHEVIQSLFRIFWERRAHCPNHYYFRINKQQPYYIFCLTPCISLIIPPSESWYVIPATNMSRQMLVWGRSQQWQEGCQGRITICQGYGIQWTYQISWQVAWGFDSTKLSIITYSYLSIYFGMIALLDWTVFDIPNTS